eukprot:10399817-Lingulodinium_polyedra.AAC.1
MTHRVGRSPLSLGGVTELLFAIEIAGIGVAAEPLAGSTEGPPSRSVSGAGPILSGVAESVTARGGALAFPLIHSM